MEWLYQCRTRSRCQRLDWVLYTLTQNHRKKSHIVGDLLYEKIQSFFPGPKRLELESYQMHYTIHVNRTQKILHSRSSRHQLKQKFTGHPALVVFALTHTV